MTNETRTMLIQSMGLVGVQMTPDIAETIIEVYRKIEAAGDISLKEVTAIAEKSNEKFGPPIPPVPTQGTPPELKKVDGGLQDGKSGEPKE